MNRRVVALLLLPFVLISQSVTFGHCPGGSSPAGHEPRPHVHLKRQSGSGSHCHKHGPCGHRHRHEDAAPESEGPLPSAPDSAPCHGSDAVFFGPGDPAVMQRENPKVEAGPSAWSCAIDPSPFAPFGGLAPVASAPFVRPPLAPPCPLYVRHLALLI